jgi:hypothetical protein
MVEMKHTRTFNKLKTSGEVLDAVRGWAKPKGLSTEDASIVKVIGSKEQIDELDQLLEKYGPKEEKKE